MRFDWGVFWATWTSSAIWEGARTTLLLAALTWAVSLVVAGPLALGRSSGSRWVRLPCAAWVWFFRGVPLLVLLIFVYNALPVAVPVLRGPLADPFTAGAVALVLSESAYMSEALRSGLLAVAAEQRDAGRALGFRPLTLHRVVVLPIALRVSVPALGNEFVSNLKNTSLVSVISLVELTLAGQRRYTQNFAVLETMSAVALFYLAMVTLFAGLQQRVEARLGRHTSGAPARRPAGGGATPVRSPAVAGPRPAPPALPPRADRSEDAPVVLEARGLHKSYGGHEVLRGVDLTVRRGEVCVLLGRSGSGKSTLLRCLNRLEVPDTGVVLLNGEPLGYRLSASGEPHPLPERSVAARRRELGMVFQRFNLFPHLTAAENVAVAPRLHGMVARRDAEEFVMPYLARVGLEQHAHKYPGQLSGGQQQRVAIARALALRPDAILLDEPTSALDPELVGEVLQVIQQLAAEGRTMVVVSHELRFAERVADTVVFMDDGRVVEDGPAARFFAEPGSRPAREFLSSVRTPS